MKEKVKGREVRLTREAREAREAALRRRNAIVKRALQITFEAVGIMTIVGLFSSKLLTFMYDIVDTYIAPFCDYALEHAGVPIIIALGALLLGLVFSFKTR